MKWTDLPLDRPVATVMVLLCLTVLGTVAVTREQLAAEIKTIADLGVKVHYGVKVGQDITIPELQEKYNAIFMGIGAWTSGTMGISGEDLKKIFEPFYTKKSMHRSGTGLGMPIVRRIVEAHGGQVAVTSDALVGTRVTLRLPIAERPVQAADAG